MGDTKIQAAAEHVAREVWTGRTSGILTYDALQPDTRTILEEVALKAICIGMMMAGIKSAKDN